MQELRFVELLRPVHGKAVGWPAQHVGQHHHLGGIGAEMRMHMFCLACLQPLQYLAGLGQVDQVVGPGAVGPQAKAHGQPQRLEEPARLCAQHLPGRCQQALDATLQHIAGPGPLACVLGVLQLGVPPAQGNTLHLYPLALQREDLATDETVADLRVLVYEISNAHRNPDQDPRNEPSGLPWQGRPLLQAVDYRRPAPRRCHLVRYILLFPL
ncbi:hypothetical protein D3C75_895780 [compost metagenome]